MSYNYALWRKRKRCGVTVWECSPMYNWRLAVWFHDGPSVQRYEWEARRFGRSRLHISGECARLDHAKRVAKAAAFAVSPKSRPL